MRPKILEEGVLHKNLNPGIRAEAAFLPNVVPISDTETLCFYRIGTAFYSQDGQLAMLRSLDGGRTWTREGDVWDPDSDDYPWNYTAPHGVLMKDGSLIVTAFRTDGSDPEADEPRPKETILFRSNDDGRSWSSPESLDLPVDEGRPDAPSQIIEINDGRWFLGLEVWKETGPFDIKGLAVFSRDRGATWEERVDFPSASDATRAYSHSRYTRTLDGRVAVLQWTQEVGTAKDFDLHLTVSDQTGTEWTSPQPTGIRGQTSWLADLGDGVFAAAYTSREGMEPGIKVVVSEDEGRTWDLENEIVVWDAVGQEYLGVERKPQYPDSHDNIAYGKPNLARLPNGELIASWWCTQACVTHARFARIAVE